MPTFIPIGRHGAIVDISFGLSVPHENDLKRRGKPIPARVLAQGLIDTGASDSMIDPSIAKKLQLIPTGKGSMHTASTGAVPHACDMYDVSLIIPQASKSIIIDAIQVSEIQLAGQGHPFLSLIGRDLLNRCVMFYNGPGRQVTLQF